MSVPTDNKMSTNAELRPKKRLRLALTEIDMCDVCDTYEVFDGCEKCGTGVCNSAQCCSIFPHRCNTEYIICKRCVDEIEEKLVMLIDLGKLRILKQRIHNGTTYSESPRSSPRSRHTSTSSSSSSSSSSITSALTMETMSPRIMGEHC